MRLNRVLTHGLPSSSWGYPRESGVVAYFSMEIAITPATPTYSGGLAVLAGDTLRAAADTGLRLAAVTLSHRKGYFRQHLDINGVQTEEDQPWDLESKLVPEDLLVHGHDGGADMGIVSLQGRITVSNANEIRHTLADALRLQPKELTVDLSNVSYMDTSGLATLMEAMRSARQQGTRLILGSIQAQPRYLLKVTDLDHVFGVEEAPTA